MTERDPRLDALEAAYSAATRKHAKAYATAQSAEAAHEEARTARFAAEVEEKSAERALLSALRGAGISLTSTDRAAPDLARAGAELGALGGGSAGGSAPVAGSVGLGTTGSAGEVRGGGSGGAGGAGSLVYTPPPGTEIVPVPSQPVKESGRRGR